jgi:hypothetical protein
MPKLSFNDAISTEMKANVIHCVLATQDLDRRDIMLFLPTVDRGLKNSYGLFWTT